MTDFLRKHLTEHLRYATPAPWTLPDQALRFDSADQVRQVVAASGNRYFDPLTQARHGNTLEPGLHDGRFFVVGHNPGAGLQVYTVNWATRAPGDDHVNIQRFDDLFTDPAGARILAAQAAHAVPADPSPALEAVPRRTQEAVTAGPALAQVHNLQPGRVPTR